MWPKFTDSAVRALIAAVVIVVTWLLTIDKYPIAEQWQAVFLLVIGYYFKDRPQSDGQSALSLRDSAVKRAVDVEILAQFGMAMLLLFATAWLFAVPQNKEFLADVAGAWVGGVTLAIAFYFKDVTPAGTTEQHSLFRSAIAVSVGVATLVIFLTRTNTNVASAEVNPLPLQWVALAFIVIAFYFKEKGDVIDSTQPNVADPLPAN